MVYDECRNVRPSREKDGESIREQSDTAIKTEKWDEIKSIADWPRTKEKIEIFR